MKIESLLTKLEGIRVIAEDLDDMTIPYQVIDALVEYIGNPRIEEKIDEIPF